MFFIFFFQFPPSLPPGPPPQAPLPGVSQNTATPHKNHNFKARSRARDEERRKKKERKKEERADRNRSPSTIAGTRIFFASRVRGNPSLRSCSYGEMEARPLKTRLWMQALTTKRSRFSNLPFCCGRTWTGPKPGDRTSCCIWTCPASNLV